MNHVPLVSDLVGHVIGSLRDYQHTGVELAPTAVSQLIRNLRTIQELARDAEQELCIQLQQQRTAHGREAVREERFANLVDDQIGGNVVRLRPRNRPVVSAPDGGDAA